MHPFEGCVLWKRDKIIQMLMKTSKKHQLLQKTETQQDNRGRVKGNMLVAELILFPLMLIVRSCSSMEQGDKEIKIVLNIFIRRR